MPCSFLALVNPSEILKPHFMQLWPRNMFYEVTAVLTADQQNPLASKWALMWENLQIS